MFLQKVLLVSSELRLKLAYPLSKFRLNLKTELFIKIPSNTEVSCDLRWMQLMPLGENLCNQSKSWLTHRFTAPTEQQNSLLKCFEKGIDSLAVRLTLTLLIQLTSVPAIIIRKGRFSGDFKKYKSINLSNIKKQNLETIHQVPVPNYWEKTETNSRKS